MTYKSAVISIGNELLLGRTVNSNLSFLGAEMALLGMPVDYSETIADTASAILDSLKRCWESYDVIICTGGLGPTEDDITKVSIAEFFGKELRYEDSVWQHIVQMFRHRNVKIAESNKRQAMVPEDFEILVNNNGTAPGLHYQEDGKHFFALPGVPFEMKLLFKEYIEPIVLKSFNGAKRVEQRNLRTFGISESALADMLSEKELPKGVHLAWLPQLGRVDLRIYGTEAEGLRVAEEIIRKKAAEYIWGTDDEEPAEVLLAKLKKNGLSLAIAESCTGGWVQKHITSIAGASQNFLGGVVSYANEVKRDVLGVSQKTLDGFGAVSEEVAIAMAKGVKKLMKSDVSLSVTGIAGPDGGTEEKPIGLVHYGFCIAEAEYHIRQVFHGKRDIIRHRAAEAAILHLNNLLRERLK